MGRNLFDIGLDLLALDDLIEGVEGDISDEAVEKAVTEWLTGLGGEEANKLDGYCNYIKTLEMEEVAARAEAEQYLAQAKARANRVKWLKERMKLHLQATKRTEARTATNRRIVIVKNGGLVPLHIDETADVAKVDDSLVIVRRELDTGKIREALNKGGVLPFAQLGERGTHLQIK
jgi:Siphovirus Gp157